MSQEFVVKLAQESLALALMLALPPLGIGLAVGLLISVLQATTQIQEQTLTFVPKIVAVLLAIFFFGSWMLNKIIFFTSELYTQMNTVIH